ncbi:MAG: sterol desaturase family protein [Flavobacteriales bacterium]|nr:sterol desaturase family protein [Flavobacteriales bacterium]
MLHSLKSVLIFGFSGLPIVYLIRSGDITLLPNTFLNVVIGIALLTAWNEIHFFVVHRIMHLPFFMRNVHIIHHTSKTPTVYSVYSFHWFEALLLSTVPLTITPFVPFSIMAIFLYPLASILLNYAGHCNYRFGKGTGASWKLFGTFHNEHHAKGKKNYGFASDLLDKLNSMQKKNG